MHEQRRALSAIHDRVGRRPPSYHMSRCPAGRQRPDQWRGVRADVAPLWHARTEAGQDSLVKVFPTLESGRRGTSQCR